MQAITTRAHHGMEAYEAQRAHLKKTVLRFSSDVGHDENRAVRTTPGTPAYFDTFPTFPAIDLNSA